MRNKVTRTLIYEGSSEWITMTLAKGAIQEDKPLIVAGGAFTIRELPRVHEVTDLDIAGQDWQRP